MKAFAIDAYGAPLHAVDRPEPVVGERDVLVGIGAAGVNPLDAMISAGDFKQILRYPMPLVLGHDLAGTVIGVGARVSRFTVGDVVYGRPRDGRIGTFAERIAVDEADLAIAPTSTDTVQAASLPLVTLTAWQALVERAHVGPGDRVLIHAGGGSVGSVAIQLAKHLGAHVATTASTRHADLVRDLGADVVIDSRADDFEQELSGYDVVLESVGGQNLLKSLTVLRPGGTAIGISGPPTPAFARSAGLPLPLRLGISALSRDVRRRAERRGVNYEFLFMHADGTQLAALTQLVDSGVIRPRVGLTVPFDETPRALDALGHDGRAGRIVITRA